MMIHEGRNNSVAKVAEATSLKQEQVSNNASESKRELTYLETILGHDPFKKRKEEVQRGIGKGSQVNDAYVKSTLQGRLGVECGGEWEDNVRLRW